MERDQAGCWMICAHTRHMPETLRLKDDEPDDAEASESTRFFPGRGNERPMSCMLGSSDTHKPATPMTNT